MEPKAGVALLNGLRGRCPACGTGRLFRRFMKVADACESCGEPLHHHRADDFPAYLVIVVVGHIVVPLSLPVRDAIETTRKKLGRVGGTAQPVALLWMGLDEPGRLIDAMLGASDHLGYRGAVVGAMGGGHIPERLADVIARLASAIPTVVSPRAGGGPMLRQTYGGPTSEIALRKAGLIWGGRLHPLKARVLLETCLRAGLPPAAIAELFDAWG